jgi:hypothetical protein
VQTRGQVSFFRCRTQSFPSVLRFGGRRNEAKAPRPLYNALKLRSLLIIRIALIYSLLVYWHLAFQIPSEIILRLDKASTGELLKVLCQF